MQLSNSEIQTWKRCRRKWFIEYYLGFGPADELPYGNRQLGIRVHTALEAHYGYDLPAVAVLQVLYRLAVQAAPEHETELRNEQALAAIMVSGYIEWAEQQGEDSDLRLIATEADVRVPMPGWPEVTLRGRLDQLVQRISTGDYRFIDHKTADSFEKQQVLDRDPQFRFYGLLQFLASGQGAPVAGMQLRPDVPAVSGGIMNTLRRVKRTGASKPPYYQRAEVRFSPEVLESTLLGVRQVALEIYNARQNFDAEYALGGRLPMVNQMQRSMLAPTPLGRDCEWSCPLATGLCVAMDDGSDWAAILERSGHFARADPYARYSDDPLREIREKL